MPSSFYTRNGYYPRLYIDSQIISDSLITETLSITRSENDAAIMELTLRPPSGVQSLSKYQGKDIILTIQTSTGIHRVFTGIIDIDEYDLQQETVTLKCTDDRFNLIKANSALVNSVGFYSDAVFGTQTDNNRILESRLTTVQASGDFDSDGVWRLTSWTPKATADFTLSSSQVYRRSPAIERTNRARLVNTVNLSLTYMYQRLHHRERNYSWDNDLTACEYLTEGYTVPTREMVYQAAIQAGWPLRSGITFTPFYESNSYRCLDNTSNTFGTYSLLGTTNVGLAYNQRTTLSVDGIDTAVNDYDSAGNPVTKSGSRLVAGADGLCIGAAWIATTRFSQNMEESYTITVVAPQSVSEYGTQIQYEQFNHNDDFDPSEWEDYKFYTSEPDDAISLEDSSDYYIDKNEDRSTFNTAFDVLINRAKTTILRSHRQNKAKFSRGIWPELQLHHTVELSTNKIEVKGKVSSLKHTIDFMTGEAYTDVELSFYTSTGSQVESSFAIPTRPSYTPKAGGGSQRLGNHYGKDPEEDSNSDTWNGYIGNKFITERQNYFKTSYTEAFIVDTPSIDDESRLTKTLTTTQTYNVSIPNNTLTVTFTGKY